MIFYIGEDLHHHCLKFSFFDECVKAIVLGQSDCWILKSVTTYERNVGWNWFFCMHINIKDFDGSNYVLLIQNAKSGSDLFYW